MNKDRFIRFYLWISVVYVLVLMYMQGQFLKSLEFMPLSNFGPISTSIFKYQFGFAGNTIEVLNVPLFMFIAFALLSGFVAYLTLREKPIEKKLLREVVVYNVLLSILLILSSIVFMLLIPNTVNGAIESGFLMTKFEVQRNEFQNAFNFTWLFMTIYVVLNVVALYSTKEKKFKEKKENIEEDSEFLL